MEWIGLVGVVVGGLLPLTGIWLQLHVSRRTERRLRTDAAAIKARDALLQIEAEEARWYDLGKAGRVPVHPDTTDAVQALRAEVLLITDRDVRERLNEVADLLLVSTSIGAFHHDHEKLVRRRLCASGREVLSANLRGDKQPSRPAFLAQYWHAVGESDEALAQIYDDANELGGRQQAELTIVRRRRRPPGRA